MSIISRSHAVVLAVPQAEACVASWRLLHDPVARRGVPAHITLLYPFFEPASLDADANDALARIVAATPPLEIALTGTARFPGVLYLTPQPADTIVGLVHRLVARFIEVPPYGAPLAEFVPHLTVAQSPDVATLDAVESALQPYLPIAARLDQVSLLVEENGRWRTARTLPFGA